MVRLSFSKREKKREHVSGGGMESREEEEKHQGTATHIHVREGGNQSKGYMEVGQREEIDL